jgi:hypothetical protein
MRNFGFILILVGIAGFVYCTSEMKGLEPLAADADLGDYFRNMAGRLELGRFAAAGAALIGLIMAFFPQGR